MTSLALVACFLVGHAALPILDPASPTRRAVARWLAVTALVSAASIGAWAIPVALPHPVPFVVEETLCPCP